VFPEDLSGRGVGTDDLLAFVGGFGFIVGDGVELSAEHDRSGATGQLFLFP
jgi:hypothetical protein